MARSLTLPPVDTTDAAVAGEVDRRVGFAVGVSDGVISWLTVPAALVWSAPRGGAEVRRTGGVLWTHTVLESTPDLPVEIVNRPRLRTQRCQCAGA
nr:hypothetical protein GCM10020241_07350 [Streptoalloteichus tenebrarius]